MSLDEGGGASAPAPDRSLLSPYLFAIGALGCGAAACLWAFDPPWRGLDGHWAILGLLALGLVLGEVRPIPVSRAGETTDQITISTPYALALITIGPIGFAIAVQVLAVLFDDLKAGRGLRKLVFNASQYVLTLVAARAVWSLLSGTPFLGGYASFDTSYVPAALAAGVVFFAVNLLLISAVVAFASGQPVLTILRDDLSFQVTTSTVLVALGPVAAVCVQNSLLLLPLLSMPILAVYHNARLAVRREQESLHDPLTGLANRMLFTERTERALSEGRRLGTSTAVMLLDLDHFKEINDTLGHQVGDEMLVEISRRLAKSAPEGATVSRLGGDEFAVLVDAVATEAEGRAIATQLLTGLAQPVVLNGIRLAVQASVGIALAPKDGDDAFSLLRRADVAMYSAKREGAPLRSYHVDNDPHSAKRLELLGDLPDAVVENRLFLVYQPQIDLLTDTVDRVEALVRWNHPVRGLVQPEEFIPLAENTGSIQGITRYVLTEALSRTRAWHDRGLALGLAVNVSVRDLADDRLIESVTEALRMSGLPPEVLTLEVTESSVMYDPQRAIQALEAVRRLGVRVAIDDFGTGQASLAYLKRLAIDELKIDKSFVTNLLADDTDGVIVRSTVELAHNLGLDVVAEGVEDLSTLAALRAIGCDTAQGYAVGMPMTAADLDRWLRVREHRLTELESA
jgi:diguanylate cyclase (GGDEF)-like protein